MALWKQLLLALLCAMVSNTAWASSPDFVQLKNHSTCPGPQIHTFLLAFMLAPNFELLCGRGSPRTCPQLQDLLGISGSLAKLLNYRYPSSKGHSLGGKGNASVPQPKRVPDSQATMFTGLQHPWQITGFPQDMQPGLGAQDQHPDRNTTHSMGLCLVSAETSAGPRPQELYFGPGVAANTHTDTQPISPVGHHLHEPYLAPDSPTSHGCDIRPSTYHLCYRELHVGPGIASKYHWIIKHSSCCL